MKDHEKSMLRDKNKQSIEQTDIGIRKNTNQDEGPVEIDNNVLGIINEDQDEKTIEKLKKERIQKLFGLKGKAK